MKILTNPINFRKNYFNYELISPGVLEHTELLIKYIDYLSDKGVIFKNEKKFNGFYIGSTKKKSQDLKSIEIIQNIIYNEFRLYFNRDDITSYQRTYRKLPEILANITSVVLLLITIGQIIVGFLCKYYYEAETMSHVLQSKLFNDKKINMKKENIIVKNIIDYKSSQRDFNNNLIDNSNSNNEMINNENFKNNSNKSINKENINKLNLINNNKTVNKNDFSIKGKSGITSENEFNKKIENNSCNNEDHIDNNNIYTNKKKLSEINSGYYSKIFGKIIRANSNGNQTKINTHSFSFSEYLYFILKKNNVRAKIIEKLSIFLQNTLSVEEIIRRGIDLEILISFIQSNFKQEFNLENHMKVWIKKDIELKKLLEDESKINDNI